MPGPFDKLSVNGGGVFSQSRYPFGLSRTRPFDRLRMLGPFDKLRPFDRLRMLGPFDKLRVNGEGVLRVNGVGVRWQSQFPFGLSLSKALDLRTRPFDKFGGNGEGLPTQSHPPFGLSLSKALAVCTRPFAKLRPFDRLRMLGPFDKLRPFDRLRVNGEGVLRVNGVGVRWQSQFPFDLSLSKALDLRTQPLDKRATRRLT